MGFASGNVTFRRFAVIGKHPSSVEQDMLDALSANALRVDADAPASELEYGWSGGRHDLDASFSFENNVFGDLSAMTQLNRAGPALARAIEETGWHARLLNGSDYPLPGVMPLYSVDYLVSLGLLAREAAPVLMEIRAHNPLLFDFVVKRHLRSRGKAFSPSVFETRRFFQVESQSHVRQ